MSLYTILFSLVCLLLLFLWIKKLISKNAEPPTYPGALPLIGHGHMFYGNGVELWKTIESCFYYSSKVGGIVKLLLGPKAVYIISDPEDITKVLNKCLDKSPFYDFGKPWLGNGLVTSHLSEWKKSRKLLSPAFSQRALCQLLDIFNKQSRRLVDNLTAEVGKEKFDHYTYILNNLVETVNETMIGLENGQSTVINKNYADASDYLAETVVQRLQNVWLHIPFLYNRSDLKKRQDKVMNNTKSLINEVIQRRKSALQRTENQVQNNGLSKTMLNYMIEQISNKGLFTNDDIRAHLETMTIASFDTTAASLVYTLMLIGAHTTVQTQILKEIDEIFGASDKDVEKGDLSKLKYLEAVIKESLRVYPVIPVIARVNQDDFKLKNYTIPSGQTIAISIHGVHRHPAWGEDVEEFKPERWLQSESPPEHLFFSFSAGRRSCIGEQYSMMLMKITLVHLIRRYCIASDNNKLVLKYNVMLKPVSGHGISIQLRSR